MPTYLNVISDLCSAPLYIKLTSQQMIEIILAASRQSTLQYLDIGANRGNIPQHIISLAEANIRTFKIRN